MRKIGVPFALINGKIERNCVIYIDEISKKICNIAVEVTDMDNISLLEYFNGLLIPITIGWEHPMTADKRKDLVNQISIDNINALTPNLLQEGYIGELLLLEKLDFKNLSFTPQTTIKKIINVQ